MKLTEYLKKYFQGSIMDFFEINPENYKYILINYKTGFFTNSVSDFLDSSYKKSFNTLKSINSNGFITNENKNFRYFCPEFRKRYNNNLKEENFYDCMNAYPYLNLNGSYGFFGNNKEELIERIQTKDIRYFGYLTLNRKNPFYRFFLNGQGYEEFYKIDNYSPKNMEIE